MKILAPACVAFSFLLAFACDRAPTSSGTADIAIHLLADDTLTAVDAYNIDLDSLTLMEEPLLSVDEIKTYTWSDHSFSVETKAHNRLKRYEESGVSTFGLPFVVVASGERVYLGGLWPSYSSYAPPFPQIWVIPLILKIREASGEDIPDVRNDSRIYEELKAAGVLRD